MKNQTSHKFLLAIRLIVSSILFVFLFAAIFSAKVSAQETPSPSVKGDSPTASGATAPNAASPIDAKAKAAAKSKKTTIDFEDQLIEGSRQKPELFYLLQNKDFNYKRLIRLREDFLPELRKSGEDVQGRSGSAQ